MQSNQIPIKFQIPFANSAGAIYITNPLPVPSQQGIQVDAASFTDGYPPACFAPGGAPLGNDTNGILFMMSSWDRWYQAGGPVQWDSSFSSLIGGYPKGAVVASVTTFGQYWLSNTENNTTNPDAAGAGWQAIYGVGSVSASSLLQSSAGLGLPMLNGQLVAMVGGNALTITVQTLAGNTPSATDPVWFVFRSPTPGIGTPIIVQVTSSLTATVPAFSTLAFAASTPARLWVEAFYSGTAVSLAVMNVLSGTSIYPLSGWGIASTTAFSAGNANGAQIFYSSSALSGRNYAVLGYLTWEAGGTLGTPGNWSAVPTRIEPFRSGVLLPGGIVQRQRTNFPLVATGVTNTFAISNAIPPNTAGDQYMTQAITPSSSANILDVHAIGIYSANTTSRYACALFQDSTTNALTASISEPVAVGVEIPLSNSYELLAGTLSSTTFKWRAGNAGGNASTFNGSAGAQEFGGVANSFMSVMEVVA